MRKPDPNDEDALLIRRLRAGEGSALDELVQRHSMNVFRLAYRLTGNYDDAQDVVSETFVRVHNRLPGFQGDINFTTWLHHIVKDVFLDARKKQRA